MKNTHNHGVLSVEPGVVVGHQGENHVVLTVLDASNVLIKNLNTHETVKAQTSSITGKIEENHNIENRPDLVVIPDSDWKIAQERFEIIQPLLNSATYKRKAKDVKEIAQKHNLGTATLYRWIQTYESTGLITSLLRKGRNDKGRGRINNELERIITKAIDKHYLKTQKPSIRSVCDVVETACRQKGITPPHPNTVRNRISSLPAELKARRRRGKDAARKFSQIKGPFPGADWPLAVVQIDHTKLDIRIVDEIDREPIARPTITLAIDVYSRMVTGYYVSLSPPSAFSVGMCIVNSVLPKDEWLISHDVKGEWPVYGLMDIIHVDNAKEFRGKMLKRACQEYGISLQWRPVGKPHYGGHVERFFRTLADEIHQLPGTTFSNIKDRAGYDSDKKASMTLKEFEEWLSIYIVEVYHQKYHSELDMSPIQKYEKGVLGDSITTGRGLPPIIGDTDRFKMDFLPFVERTVQQYGFVIDGIHYNSDVLRPWIHSENPQTKRKQKFIIRYDPRNMSKVFFLDPQLNEYFQIPYNNNRFPPISIWEIRSIKKKLKTEGQEGINEDIIFDAYEKMQQKAKTSVSVTRKERLKKQQKKEHQRNNISLRTPPTKSVNSIELEHLSITPFDEIED